MRAMIFFISVAILAIIGYSIYRLIKQESERRERRRQAEEDFLAQARANPRGTTGPSPASPARPATPPARAMEDARPNPVMLSASHHAGGPASSLGAPALAAEPVVAPLAPPQTGACHFCHLPVDLRANDQRRWGVKMQEPGADRLTWVHFQCLATRLSQAESERRALTDLIAAFEATLSGASASAGEASTPSLKEALTSARGAIGVEPARSNA